MLSLFYPGIRYFRAKRTYSRGQGRRKNPVVRSGQPIRITMRAAQFHQSNKARRELSRRVRGLEYLQPDEELIARYQNRSELRITG